MNYLSKPVWFEGMYLGPHQFQLQSRYFEDVYHFAASSLWFRPYGLIAAEFDEDALRNGIVSIVDARGIFPDGLPFVLGESDPLPAPRNVTELFSPLAERLTVFLAVPPRKPSGQNFALDSAAVGDQVRYVAQPQLLPDEVTGADEKEVKLGRKNIRIVVDAEEREQLVTLAVARVMRDGTGHLVYDPDFVPPCLLLSASRSLVALANRLVEMLEEKGGAFSGSGPRGARISGGFSTEEVQTFWFRHSVNSALAALRHLVTSKRSHPEELYLELSRLAGALCTFGLRSHPGSLPLYDHENLEGCFRELYTHVQSHLEMFRPSRAIAIALRPVSKYLYAGEIGDQRCLDRARWILGIHAAVEESELISKASQFVKICSAQFVGELVKRALPGLSLRHLQVPPAAIAARVESQYFSVSRSGPCWDSIVKTRQVGVYVPGDLPNPELELLAIPEV
jgi:type VI secretion system protein ImpJ